MSELLTVQEALLACTNAKQHYDESMRKMKAEKIRMSPTYDKLLKLYESNREAFNKGIKKILPKGVDVSGDAALIDALTRQANAWEAMSEEYSTQDPRPLKGGALCAIAQSETLNWADLEKQTALPQKVLKAYKKNVHYRRSTTLGILWEIGSWIVTILGALAIVLFIRSFIFEPIRVDGRSMTNTLQDNDFVFSSKLDYLFGDVKRGDIVICHYKTAVNSDTYRTSPFLFIFTEKTRFVKRVVGVPGDTLEIRYDTARNEYLLYVNGQVSPDVDYAYPISTYSYQNMLMGSDGVLHEKITLGENEYYVIGDNRGNSHDSRALGPISRDMIIGHVRCVLWPLTQIRDTTADGKAWQELNP